MSNQASATASSSSGIGLFGLTFLVLLVGKLGFGWNISWLVVFSPLIIGFVLFLIFIAIVLVIIAKT